MAKMKDAAPAAPKVPAAPGTPAAAPPPAAPKAEKPPKPVVEKPVVEKNGVTRPKAGSACAKIWDAADGASAKKKAPATYAEVAEVLKADALNEATMRTQFQRWRVFNGLAGTKAPAAA